ncbi:MAG: hypothetical protein DI586_02480 [Micavibrio aeruginosavorus]|uniref:Hemolysin-type calcium-binding repeat family protein n=1 Tax=Micavibrio aeruginosavorus TaxID=349221 RepID=A0A2W5FSM2_9BACT|nr:MAG: hypothetical protein DI586_02480 [Micavibrio aeruginosavorus]
MTTISGTNGYASSNGWVALTNPWGSSSLQYGKDYAVSANYNPDNLSSGLTFNWSYPKNNLPWTAIKAYPDVGFGASPWGRGQSDPAHVFPIQVQNLKDLDMAYDVTYGGDKNGYNVSYDIWFTSEPNGGTSTITTELMIWLHKGGVNAHGKLMGTYSDGYITGKIYSVDNYIALISDTELTKGEIDLTAIVNKLVGMGLMSSSEYLASIQFGAEVVEGTGSLTINNLEYDVTSINAEGHEIHQVVTGLGVEGVNEITGTSGNDYLPGDSLDNVVHAGAGNDDIQPGKGNDTVYAGAGNDKIFAGEGNDIVYGDDGDDTMSGDAGNDELHGGAGSDIFLDVLGSNTMSGDDGNDSFYLSGAKEAQRIDGGNGADRIYTGAGHDILHGGAGDDLIQAASGDDIIWGDDGADSLYGGDGKDVIWGGSGNDKVEGGAGNDVLFGEAGIDVMLGGDGDDEIYGGNENDTMSGNAGNDLMHGGSGNDNLDGNEGDDIVIGGDGDDIVRGGSGNDEVYGDAGNDTLYGDAGNDKIFAHAGNDKLYGGDGNDIMGGGEGADILYGDAGNDMFFLSEGSDTIYGGLGKDQYKFTKEGLNGVDKIYFNVKEGDWLDFTMIIDQKTDVTTKNINEFLKATQVGNDTVVSVDVDGSANGSKFTDAAVLVGEHNVDLTAWMKSGNIVA